MKNVKIPKQWFVLASKAYSAMQDKDEVLMKEHLMAIQWRIRTNQDENTKEMYEVDNQAWCQVLNSSYAIQAGDVDSSISALEKANKLTSLTLQKD